MSIKEKVRNKVNEYLDKYKPYDVISSMDIEGIIKSAISNYDGTYIKELNDKNQKGIISINKLLDDELKESKNGTITFCEDGNVVCITKNKLSDYVETSHEYFEMVNEKMFLVCKNKEQFNRLKEYINQSSKWHNSLDEVREIPNKATFEKLFNVKDKEIKFNEKIVEENKQEKEIEINKNYVQIEGNISKIGKEFKKKDGTTARFIELRQHYKYNDKVKSNTISIMLEGEVLKEYSNKINLNDKILITGNLINYTGRTSQTQSVINSYDLEILNRNKNKEVER